MTIYVANPLYDAVFKYLMEDERIARTILSALLKKKVLSVKTRRNEYANLTRSEAISMFRIDFAATVVDEDGAPHLMLIELQKTWLPTETLRFRRYLALQYNNEENMVSEPPARYAIPMVAIYLLGHRVGNITAPVIYVNHKAYDYDNNVVTEGMPDPFVESLQHDSIIVQIPLLHGQVNNRLEQILSVFDQSNVADDKKVLRIDNNQFEGDNDMQYMVHRLQTAAADPDMRYQMNAEDEYFRELEDRDTAIMERDKKLEEQGAKLEEQDAKITEQDAKITEQGAKLEEQGAKLEEQGAKLEEQGAKLEEQGSMLRVMISSMMETGKSVEEIATLLGKSQEEIMRLIS